MVAGADGLFRFRQQPANVARINRAAASHGMASLDVYDTIRCPVLFVGAESGGRRRFGVEAIKRVAQRYAGLRVEWLECGHDVIAEKPEELTRLIVGFEATLEASTT